MDTKAAIWIDKVERVSIAGGGLAFVVVSGETRLNLRLSFNTALQAGEATRRVMEEELDRKKVVNLC